MLLRQKLNFALNAHVWNFVVCVFVTENFFYTFSIHLSFMNEFNTNLNICNICIVIVWCRTSDIFYIYLLFLSIDNKSTHYNDSKYQSNYIFYLIDLIIN